MSLPVSLKNALENCATQYSINDLKKSALSVSETYRVSKRSGSPLVSKELDVVAYALARMPATFAALSKVFENVKPCQTMLDVGAGTGAATWAAKEMKIANQIICLEKADKMRELGLNLMKSTYADVEWRSFDLLRENLSLTADLVVASYVLNELDNDVQLKAAEKLWQATKQTLVIIEPGTPIGFEIISKIRKHLLGKGAFITAPCPQALDCPLAKDDWCHFTCRLERSQIHKMLKGGDAPYEDEKFSYLVLSHQPVSSTYARILRHPYIEKGKVELQLCTSDGLKTRIVTRKEKQQFKIARKSNAGDEWNE